MSHWTLCTKHTSFASFEIASAAAENARASELVHIYTDMSTLKQSIQAGLNISLSTSHLAHKQQTVETSFTIL